MQSGKPTSAENLLALRGSTQMTMGALSLGSHAKYQVTCGLKKFTGSSGCREFPKGHSRRAAG
jgi:hypothetical protein